MREIIRHSVTSWFSDVIFFFVCWVIYPLCHCILDNRLINRNWKLIVHCTVETRFLKVTVLDHLTKIPLSCDEMKHYINETYIEIWKNMWWNSDQNLTCFKPQVGVTAFSDAPRPLQVALTRMRLDVTLLSHGHYFSGTPKKLCRVCRAELSPRHLLIDCPQYTQNRREIIRYCNSLKKPVDTSFILSPAFPVDILCNFLRDTKLQTEIWAAAVKLPQAIPGTRTHRGDVQKTTK